MAQSFRASSSARVHWCALPPYSAAQRAGEDVRVAGRAVVDIEEAVAVPVRVAGVTDAIAVLVRLRVVW